MRLTIEVPEDLERLLRDRAEASAVSPTRYVESILRTHLASRPRRFSKEFLDLAGTWEDDRSSDEIVRDIEESRIDGKRPHLS
jgi:hypothetical protein